MSSKNRLFVKDRLVSGEFFEILWNQKKERGETQLPPATELSAYYKSNQYASHKTEKRHLLIGFILLFNEECLDTSKINQTVCFRRRS
jgi:hypothetical protein